MQTSWAGRMLTSDSYRIKRNGLEPPLASTFDLEWTGMRSVSATAGCVEFLGKGL